MSYSSDMSTSNQYIVYQIEMYVNSQDQVANTSNVQVKVWIRRTNNYETWGNGTCYCKVDGVTYSDSISNSVIINQTKKLLLERNITINHNSDGAKTLNMSAWISHDRFSSSEQSWNVPLPKILRSSPISVTPSTVDAGQKITITIDKASSGFTHDLHIVHSGTVYSIAKKTSATSMDYTIPMEILNKIPNSTWGKFTLYCDAFTGTTQLGTSTTIFQIDCPNGTDPTFDELKLERVDNGVPAAWGVYVKGKSKVKYTIVNPKGIYGSTISTYNISGCGGTWSSQSLTTGELNATGTQTFTATIRDSRGRTKTKTNAITIYDYYNPTLNYFTAQRCLENGTLDEDGQYLKVRVSYSFASVNGKNTSYCKVRWKPKSSQAWSSDVSVSNNADTIIGNNAISSNSGYDIQVRIGDAFTEINKIVDVPTAKTTMDFRNGGNGIAIGKVSEKDGLEIDWDTTFNKKVNGYAIGSSNSINRSCIPSINSDGTMEIGRYLDFHYASNDGKDYDARLGVDVSGNLTTGLTSSKILHEGICKSTFSDVSVGKKEGFTQLNSTDRLFFGWFTITGAVNGWGSRRYIIPNCTEIYEVVLTAMLPSTGTFARSTGIINEIYAQMYDMEAASIEVRYIAVGR